MTARDEAVLDLDDKLDSIAGWALAFAALANTTAAIEPKAVDVMARALVRSVTAARERFDVMAVLSRSAS